MGGQKDSTREFRDGWWANDGDTHPQNLVDQQTGCMSDPENFREDGETSWKGPAMQKCGS